MIIWKGVEYENYEFDRSTNTIIGRKPLTLVPNTRGYLRFNLFKNNKTQGVLFHRFIYYMYHPLEEGWEKLEIDHIDRNRLNNSLDNLRLVSHSQNQMNSLYNSKRVYHCVAPKGNKFEVGIKVNGKYRYLGRFDTELEAAKHYNEVIKTLPDYEYRIKNKF